MKRSLSSPRVRGLALTVAGTCLIAGTYGLVRLAYGLFLPDIQDSVAMSASTAGYVSSGASAAYCLGALAGLVAPQRPRLLVGAALSTAAVGAVGMAFSPGTTLLVPSAVLASAGAGFASPGMVAVVARNFPAPQADRAQAVVNSGTGPGLVIAGALALLLSDWRLGLAIGAGFTGLAGLVVLLLDRADQQPPTGSALPSTASAAEERTESWRWLTGLSRPITASMLLGVASAAVWTYGRSHLVSAGTSETGSVLAWMAIGLGGTATALSARAMNRLAPPTAWVLTTCVAAIAIAGLARPDRLTWALLACGVFGWGFVAASSALISWTALLDPDRAAAGTAVAFVALVVGQAAGSSLVGVLSGRISLAGTFVLAGLTAALAAACGLRPPRGQRPPSLRPTRSSPAARPVGSPPARTR